MIYHNDPGRIDLNNPFQTNWIFHKLHTAVQMVHSIWASSRENLSSGFPTKCDTNQLKRLARKLKFRS